MEITPPVRRSAVMTLDAATIRYGLDPALRARVAHRLADKAHQSIPAHVPAYSIADIEEAVLLERELDICPQCGASCRPGWRRCERCRMCVSCDL